MDSFISAFKKVSRSYLAWLVCAVIAGFSLCVFYSTRLDPELNFWRTAFLQKREWSRQLTEAGGEKVVFAGGSSCTFSIRPDVLKEYGINAVNMGGHAGMGALFLCGFAFDEVKPGDTLILALEPDLLNHRGLDCMKLGVQAGTALGDRNLAVAGAITGRTVSMQEWAGAMRPGGRHVVTMFLKLILRRPLYRYSVDELGVGGWAYTSYDRESARGANPRWTAPDLAFGGVQLLSQIKAKCDQRGIRVAYAIPWVFTGADALDINRAYYRGVGEEISRVIPVLNDPNWGAVNEPDWFADTDLHLKPQAAEIRSRQVAKLIQNWDVIYNPAIDD